MLKIERVVAAALAGVVVSAAAAQDAVQWRVEDGGNGHWYALKDSKSGRWTVHRGLAVASGADLASIGSAEENAFIADLLPAGNPSFVIGPSIGLLQVPGSSEPSGGWSWVDGTPLDYINWFPGEPNNYGSEHWGKLRGSRSNLRWNDVGEDASDSTEALATAAIWEWSADCNGDGLVDYGQILDGTFADNDDNGVPDCCEPPCEGDLNLDNRVDSADLGLLIAAWNTDGSIVAGSDLNGDGVVNAADLGLQIVNWGKCSGCN